MTKATNHLVIDHSLVQEEAKKIRESNFLFRVAYNIAAQAVLHLFNRDHVEQLQISNKNMLINGDIWIELRFSTYTHEWLRQVYQNDDKFWLEMAEWVLQQEKENFQERFRSESTNRAVAKILDFIELPKLRSCELEQLLGLWQHKIEEANHKISQSQKIILCTLFQRVQAIPEKDLNRVAFEWDTREWLTALPKATDASLSTSLRRLAERKLLYRHDKDGELITEETERKRTFGVRISDLGFLVAKEIMIEENRKINNGKTRSISFHVAKTDKKG